MAKMATAWPRKNFSICQRGRIYSSGPGVHHFLEYTPSDELQVSYFPIKDDQRLHLLAPLLTDEMIQFTDSHALYCFYVLLERELVLVPRDPETLISTRHQHLNFKEISKYPVPVPTLLELHKNVHILKKYKIILNLVGVVENSYALLHMGTVPFYTRVRVQDVDSQAVLQFYLSEETVPSHVKNLMAIHEFGPTAYTRDLNCLWNLLYAGLLKAIDNRIRLTESIMIPRMKLCDQELVLPNTAQLKCVELMPEVGLVIAVEYVCLDRRLYPRELGYYVPATGQRESLQFFLSGLRMSGLSALDRGVHQATRRHRNGLTLIPRGPSQSHHNFERVLDILYAKYCERDTVLLHSDNRFWKTFNWDNMCHIESAGALPLHLITEPCREHLPVAGGPTYCARSCAQALNAHYSCDDEEPMDFELY